MPARRSAHLPAALVAHARPRRQGREQSTRQARQEQTRAAGVARGMGAKRSQPTYVHAQRTSSPGRAERLPCSLQ